MNQETQNQLFRLAAVLYADNNYDVTPKTIHRKIIESVLLECGKKEYSIHQIIDFIQDKYSITFEEEGIKDIADSKKETGFLTNYRNADMFVCLSEKRKLALEAKISNKTIDFFIGEFQKEYEALVTNVDSKGLIYRFLYEIFSTNTTSFQKLIDNQKDLSGLINLESTNYSSKEKEIINNFLRWDNPAKNKAIFDISSYSLEYCMLTNKNGGSSIHLKNLKNKVFYLDTNIIYRALGINGEDRKKRSKTFLKKFSDSGENLIISKATEDEFKDGLKGHAIRIRKYDSPRVNSQLFQEVQVQKDVYNYYHKWRIGKTNANLDLFVADVFSVYDEFKREFKIEVDNKRPFKFDDDEVDEVLKDYSSSITTFKTKQGSEIIGSATVDAENILWLEKKRGEKMQNIFDTKYFFISTDQSLRRWDYQRENKTPIVLLPSQWMSILLRYLERTDDDFKSFVNFLNLKNNEVLIDSEKLHIVLSGISEMTSSLNQQRTILNNLIENKFAGVVAKGWDSDKIFESAKMYAKTKLEKTVEVLEQANRKLSSNQEALSNEIASHKDAVTSKIEKLESDNNAKSEKLSVKEQENQRLKQKLQSDYKKKRLRIWRRPAYWCIVAAILVIIAFYLQIFHTDWEYNYVHKLTKYIDSNPSETKREWMKQLDVGLIAILGGSLLIIYKRLISKDSIEDKKESINSNMPADIK